MSELNLILNADKEIYLDEFCEKLGFIIEKQVLHSRALKTKFAVKDVSSTIDRFSRKFEYTLTNGNKRLVFEVLVAPWLWTEGSLRVDVLLKETKNLVIPKRKIEESAPRPLVYRPNQSNTAWFMKVIEPMNNYLKIIELTPLDVGLFDNVESALRNLLK